MSKITEYLQQILSARYGRDVRQSIHDSIKELDEIATTAQDSATANAQTAISKASEALTASQEATQKAQEALESAEQAKMYAENAEAVTGVNIATQDKAGLVKGGDIYIDEDGALVFIKETTESSMPNSHAGRLKINEIGGVMEQDSTTGKNLFDLSELTAQTINGVTFTPVYAENGTLEYINVNGTATAQTQYKLLKDMTPIKENCVVSGCAGGSSSTYSIVISYYNNEKKWSGETYNINSDIAISTVYPLFTMNILVRSGVTMNNVKFYPMLRETGTDATYEPYTNGASPNPSYPQEIRNSVISGIKTHKKNMLDFTVTRNSLLYLLPIKEGQSFTVSYNYADTSVDSRCALYIFDEIGSYASADLEGEHQLQKTSTKYAETTGRTSITITANADGYLYFRQVTPANYENFSNFQVEEGTEATPYEPYTESVITFSQPIELYGKDGVQDILTSKQIGRKYAKVVFDGSDDEAWSASTTAIDGRNRFKPQISGKPNGIVFCTILTGVDYNTLLLTDIDNVIALHNDNGVIQCVSTSYATLEEWEAYLQSNPMTVVYELAEETTEELPIADQIALNSLQTFDGITYVEFVSDVQPTFKAEYGTSKVGGYMLESLFAKPVAHEHNQLKCGGYTLLMQEDGNLVLYSPDGAPLWDSESDRNKGKIDLLCDFTGTSETIVDLSDKGHIPSRYSLIIAELYGPDGVVGSTTFPAGMAAADGLKRYVYGSSAETWGRVGVGDTNITCNRTSATTTSMKVYGIR